jgi:hypothetical protein
MVTTAPAPKSDLMNVTEKNVEPSDKHVIAHVDNNPNPNDWFIITFQLETGERALYFVPAS